MRKKILIVVPSMPYPINSGGRIIQFQINNRLSVKHDVSLMFPLRIQDKTLLDDFARTLPDIRMIPLNIEQTLFQMMAHLVRRTETFVNRILFNVGFWLRSTTSQDKLLRKETTLFRSRDHAIPSTFEEEFRSFVKDNNFDIVQIEFHQLIHFGKWIPDTSFKVFIYHEIRHIREMRELEIYSFKSRIFSNLYAGNMKYEITSLNHFNLICTLSENDKAVVENTNPSIVAIASPIAPACTPDGPEFYFNNTLVFLGGEDHLPNKEGVDWFLQNCFPLIKIKNNDIRFKIVGKWHAETIKHYTSKYSGLYFNGFVEDLGDAIRGCIFVVPIRIGSGIRMKIFDAVNSCIPFVTTTTGVEGLDFKHEKDCLIADSPEDFTNAILRILNDLSFARILAKEAKRTLSVKYNYEKLIQERLNIYDTYSI